MSEGPFRGEKIWGFRVDIVNLELHPDASQRTVGQIIPQPLCFYGRRAPLHEPVYLCNIYAKMHKLRSAHLNLNRSGGSVIPE